MKQIVVIEDCDEDYDVLEYALQEHEFSGSVVRFNTGDSFLESLSEGKLSQDTWLVMLDLNLPGTNGTEVLKKFKENKHFKGIPTIILSTSKDHRDVYRCYSYGANSYIQKPVDFKNFIEMLGKVLLYWEKISITPSSV